MRTAEDPARKSAARRFPIVRAIQAMTDNRFMPKRMPVRAARVNCVSLTWPPPGRTRLKTRQRSADAKDVSASHGSFDRILEKQAAAYLRTERTQSGHGSA